MNILSFCFTGKSGSTVPQRFLDPDDDSPFAPEVESYPIAILDKLFYFFFMFFLYLFTMSYVLIQS